MWRILARPRIDLVILDLLLTGDDGLVLCRKLRADSEIPVIIDGMWIRTPGITKDSARRSFARHV